MDSNAYWLIVLDDDRLVVALASRLNGHHVLTATGSILAYDINDQDLFLAAVDQSLASVSEKANLTPETEPQTASFVIPPSWVGQDGKIISHYSKLIGNLCKKFSFKALGFISNDEAIVEEANLKDSFPSSFILVHFDSSKITVSLAYLGKIKTRLQRSLSTPFNPSLIENALLELKTDAALPPEMILSGAVNDEIYNSVAAYPWVGKKNIETFLHFPEVKKLSIEDSLQIYIQVITQELSPSPLDKKPLTTDSFYETEVEDDSLETETNQSEDGNSSVVETIEDTAQSLPDDKPEDKIFISDDSADQAPPLLEVSPDDLGFNLETSTPPSSLANLDVDNSDSLQLPETQSLPLFEATQINPSSPPALGLKNKFSSLKNLTSHLSFLPSFSATPLLYLLALSPLLALIPFGFAYAQVTLFVNPYNFDKEVNVTLDPSVTEFSPGSSIIPVDKITFSVSVPSTRNTSGKKTIGDKAKGEVVIYNKVAKSQTLPAGTVLSTGNQIFELTTAVSVASSSSNLDEGVITLGQTKAIVVASDIGPEYNLAKSTQLNFKDIPETSLVARVSEPFSGGSKREINAVSEKDRNDLKAQVQGSLQAEIDKKIEQELPKTPGILRDTLKVSENKMEFNREIGEEASELTATLSADISVMSLKPDSTKDIISHFLKSETDFNNALLEPQNFTINFTIKKTDQSSATGVLSLKGTALPKLDNNQIKKDIKGKFSQKAISTIKNISPRIYNYKIDQRLPYLGGLTPLPFSAKRIDLQIKTK